MNKFYVIISALITGVIIMTSGDVLAEAGKDAVSSSADALVLQTIMQDMSKSMRTITDAISREDWKLVEKIAPQIADHAQPPLSEKIRILAFIGTDVNSFKEADRKTNTAARVLEESAAREDGYAVISDFAILQNTCLMCHQRFRKQFQQHFYGKR